MLKPTPLWSALPDEIRCMVVTLLGPRDWDALSQVDRDSHALLRSCPALPWMQQDLMQALQHKRCAGFVEGARQNQAALRARLEPVAVPQYSAQEALENLAELVRGSLQRPRLRFTKIDALNDVRSVPREIQATFELHHERWLHASQLQLPGGLSQINLSFTRIGASIGSLLLPEDTPQVLLHGVGLGERAGELRLNAGARFVGLNFNALAACVGLLRFQEGVQHVSLTNNNLGEHARAVNLPSSVRKVDMQGNNIDAATAAILRGAYPDVEFQF